LCAGCGTLGSGWWIGVVGCLVYPKEDADRFQDFCRLIEQRGFRPAHRALKYPAHRALKYPGGHRALKYRDASLHPFGINTFYYPFERY
jgi:hypothetical protein